MTRGRLTRKSENSKTRAARGLGLGFFRMAVEKFRVENLHHRAARTGGADHDFGIAEDVNMVAGGGADSSQ